jgi:hypothetical protein
VAQAIQLGIEYDRIRYLVRATPIVRPRLSKPMVTDSVVTDTAASAVAELVGIEGGVVSG